MAGIQHNETGKFPYPFCREAYAIIVYAHPRGKLMERQYYYGEEKDMFFTDCKFFTEEKISFKVYGIWHGKWSTDVFVLDWEELEKKAINEQVKE